MSMNTLVSKGAGLVAAALLCAACDGSSASGGSGGGEAGSGGGGGSAGTGGEPSGGAGGSGGSTSSGGSADVWKPSPDAPIAWHWQLSTQLDAGQIAQLSDKKVFDLDGELTSAET